jgi:hypothetical protein
MHAKKKGNIGQFAVALALAKLGYSVFTEEGDISKVDLIAEKGGQLLRFQCKAITPVNDCLRIPLKKSGPGYKFHYAPEMFDYFGVYDLQDARVYVVPAAVLKTANNAFTLRKLPAKNKQTKGVHSAVDYAVEKFLC